MPGVCPRCRDGPLEPALLAGGALELLDELSRDALGVVYRARDHRSGCHVAVRFLPAPADPGGAGGTRLDCELRALRSLRHPGIVPVIEVGGGAGGEERYVVSEMPVGRALPRELPLPTRRAVVIAARMADAVAYAHARGVVHGDLGAGDVYLDGRGRPRIVRFGLAAPFAEAPPRLEGDAAAVVHILARALAVREDQHLLPPSLERILASAASFASAADLGRALAVALAALDRPAAAPWRAFRGVSLDGREPDEPRP